MTPNPQLQGAVIGCRLAGHKRAKAFGKAITVCCDVEEAHAEQMAKAFPGVWPTTDWRYAVERDDIDFVVVAAPHEMAAAVATFAAAAGKHVLIEAPGGRRAAELDPVAAAAARTGVIVRAGFHHRFHRAFRKAREIFESGALGEMMFIRGRYGHAGRPEPSGGELLDQGCHLVDLSRWFLGDFTGVIGRAPTYFWNTPAEDNGFLILETAAGQTAFLHASSTEWKNLFSFEISGRVGKLEVSGLGGSYGIERLTWYKMSPEMGPPETSAWEYPMADDSWDVECAAFLEDIRLRRQATPGIADAQAALRVIERIRHEKTS